MFPFKEHYVADLSKPIEEIVSKGHRRDARRALRKVVVELCPDPSAFVDEWAWLYGSLIRRHGIQGLQRFSRAAFDSQLRVPGVCYFRALCDGQLVGGNVVYVQNDVAYFHLSAFTDRGYSLGASYAIKWTEIEYFLGKVSWMHLGASPGVDQAGYNGLASFKRGWATETRPVYFCGRILDKEKYAKLASASETPDASYFPTYRAGEFA